jgi:hypothetical protein
LAIAYIFCKSYKRNNVEIGSKMAYSEWQQITVSPSKVELDSKNPRLDLGSNPSQAQIIQHMLTNERVGDLLKSIAQKGFNKLEPVALIKEGERYIVIEGNRRLTACKLLLNKKLVPKGAKIPEVNKSLLQALKEIPAVVAPSREDALSYIIQRHVSGGTLAWSTEARLRAVMNLYNTGTPVSEIVAKLGLKKGQVESSIKEYKLLSYVKQLPTWTAKEKAAFVIQTNPFTRFFALATKDRTQSAAEILGLYYDPDFNVRTKGNKVEFGEYLEAIARGFLLPPRRFNTRTTVESVFDEVGYPEYSFTEEELPPEVIDKSNIDKVNPVKDPQPVLKDIAEVQKDSNPIAQLKPSIPLVLPKHETKHSKSSDIAVPIESPIKPIELTQITSVTLAPEERPETDLSNTAAPTLESASAERKPKRHTPKPFLKGLHCSVKDDVLACLTDEINTIDYERFPMAAAMLTRTLIHTALLHLFKSKGRVKALQDDGFSNILRRTIGEQAHLFEDKDRKAYVTVIENFLNGKFKDYLDKIVHPNNVIKCTPSQIEDIGEQFRGLLDYILDRRSYTE